MTGYPSRPWSDVFEEVGSDWADKEAAAQLLENCRSAVMAEWCADQGDIPVNKAEQKVKASPEWRDYNERMVEARRLANRAKIKMESVKMRSMEQHAKEANYRAESRLA